MKPLAETKQALSKGDIDLGEAREDKVVVKQQYVFENKGGLVISNDGEIHPSSLVKCGE